MGQLTGHSEHHLALGARSYFRKPFPRAADTPFVVGDRRTLPPQQQGQFPTHGTLLETKVPGSLGARLRRRCMEWFAGLLKPCADKIGQIDLFGV